MRGEREGLKDRTAVAGCGQCKNTSGAGHQSHTHTGSVTVYGIRVYSGQHE